MEGGGKRWGGQWHLRVGGEFPRLVPIRIIRHPAFRRRPKGPATGDSDRLLARGLARRVDVNAHKLRPPAVRFPPSSILHCPSSSSPPLPAGQRREQYGGGNQGEPVTPTLFRRPGASPAASTPPTPPGPRAGRSPRRHGGAEFSLVEILAWWSGSSPCWRSPASRSCGSTRAASRRRSRSTVARRCSPSSTALTASPASRPPSGGTATASPSRPATRAAGNFGDFWRDVPRQQLGQSRPGVAVPVPPPFTEEAPFLDADIVKNTNLAMYVLMTIPANNAAVAKLPPRATQKWTTDDPESTAIDERAACRSTPGATRSCSSPPAADERHRARRLHAHRRRPEPPRCAPGRPPVLRLGRAGRQPGQGRRQPARSD